MNPEHVSASLCNAPPLVYVVDDDETVRNGLSDLLASADLECRCFASTDELLANAFPERPSCLILDLRIPGGSGLELQSKLNLAGQHLPIIFMTGYGDVESCARAMKRGALEFFVKPFHGQAMLDAIAEAIDLDRIRRAGDAKLATIIRFSEMLTKREAEVMWLVVDGLANKQIAAKMGITEVTVKLHRGNVMHKMEASSLADLVRKAEFLASNNLTSGQQRRSQF